MSDLNRRQFVVATTAASCACALCGSADAEIKKTGPAFATDPVDVGTKADYPKDGDINDKFTKTHRIIIVRNDGKIYALDSTCTHKNCAVKKDVKTGAIICPCHGSHYSLEGTPTKKPAKEPLLRYGIKLDDKGHIIVVKANEYSEKDWDKEGAFLKA